MRNASLEDIFVTTTCAALAAWIIINWFAGCGTFTRTPDGYVTGTCFLMPSLELHIHDLPQ